MNRCKRFMIQKALYPCLDKALTDKDIAQAEDIINQMISEGWELQQIACPGDWAGALVGVFYREKK